MLLVQLARVDGIVCGREGDIEPDQPTVSAAETHFTSGGRAVCVCSLPIEPKLTTLSLHQDDIYTQLYEHIDRLNLNNNNNTVPSSFEERTHHHHHHQPKPKVSGESTNSANIYANTSGGSVARLKSNRLPSKNCSNLLCKFFLLVYLILIVCFVCVCVQIFAARRTRPKGKRKLTTSPIYSSRAWRTLSNPTSSVSARGMIEVANDGGDDRYAYD